MTNTNNTLAVFPGTFDPVTIGHVDLIHRAAAIFPRIIVGVGHNPMKKQMFTTEERVAMMQDLLSDMANVSVQPYSGLTMEFVSEVKGKVILRGIRDTVDLRDELQFANANLIVGDIETVFLMTTHQHALTSSTLIKQIVELGGAHIDRLSHLVPPTVLERLKSKLRPSD